MFAVTSKRVALCRRHSRSPNVPRLQERQSRGQHAVIPCHLGLLAGDRAPVLRMPESALSQTDRRVLGQYFAEICQLRVIHVVSAMSAMSPLIPQQRRESGHCQVGVGPEPTVVSLSRLRAAECEPSDDQDQVSVHSPIEGRDGLRPRPALSTCN